MSPVLWSCRFMTVWPDVLCSNHWRVHCSWMIKVEIYSVFALNCWVCFLTSSSNVTWRVVNVCCCFLYAFTVFGVCKWIGYSGHFYKADKLQMFCKGFQIFVKFLCNEFIKFYLNFMQFILWLLVEFSIQTNCILG